ncbi:orf111 [Artaxa digramma nucleopolyhedrovirus]|uniref:Orf111 n=1 Tax=Artaxa digramma nucleopolyhedrovirus TaxID=3070910 RepID=A0AAE6R6Q0_9ABAC|nr:orf111 [Euproctis digramma nucleopolyhedrovirus]QHB21770.1 orf111 [Artaxa digramma nucleopolyhedrovirus]
MVYIKLEIGSRAKGYGVSTSDRDYVIFTKSSEDLFLRFIDNKQLLVNRHENGEDGNDYVYVDLYKGLMGIYTGNYYYLIFAQQKDVVDETGALNVDLYKFIRELTEMRIVNVMRTMMRYKVVEAKVKFVLALMFNCAYVEHWLERKRAPDQPVLPAMLSGNERALCVYQTLMEKRSSNSAAMASAHESEFVACWREKLTARLAHVPPLPEVPNVRKSIVMYMLNLRGPVMPDDVVNQF